jgi:hypothetical protein
MERNRGALLTVIAILFAVLAVSDLLKPLHLEGPTTGFVFLGVRQHGIGNLVLGPLFGIILLVYAYGIWGMRRYALPLGIAYAAYVTINLFAFVARNPQPTDRNEQIFGIVYTIVALTISWATAFTLFRRRAQLG